MRDRLEKSGYRFTGKGDAAVKVCEWTKKSIRGEGFCYKQKFYGIESHRCLQMTPSVRHCTMKCVYCWRDTEITIPKWTGDAEEPGEIIDGCIREHKKLLEGFWGHEGADKKKVKEAQEPKHAAISLAGEPTIYPKIGEMIDEYARRGMTTFLVTNGTKPERLKKLEREPTQIYVSVDTADKEMFERLNQPVIENAWEKVNETLELLPTLSCKKVLRMTVVKGWNDKGFKEYARMAMKAEPDHIEVKSYMCIGHSRDRGLRLDNMPKHEEILEYAGKIAEEMGYKVADEKADSRVVLLSRK